MEFVALLATIIAVISIWIGINQLKIMRDEKNVNEKRMLTEYSIKVLEIFASTIIPTISVYHANTKEGKANLDKNVPDREEYSKNRFKMQNKRKLDQHQLTEIILCGKYDCGNILNVFEHTCVYITNDLVDEDIVYPPVHHVLLEFVESNAIFLAYLKSEDIPYKNLIYTYYRWKKRSKMEA